MGNAALCVPSIISNANGSTIKVISMDGRLLVYGYSPTAPVMAAEIMMENPGHFLCESRALKPAQSIPGMSAEDVLEKGQLYFLLPMGMLHSLLTAQQINNLLINHTQSQSHTNSRGIKQGTTHFSSIFPEFCLFPNGSMRTVGEDDACESRLGDANTLTARRCCRQKSWRPGLETIVET